MDSPSEMINLHPISIDDVTLFNYEQHHNYTIEAPAYAQHDSKSNISINPNGALLNNNSDLTGMEMSLKTAKRQHQRKIISKSNIKKENNSVKKQTGCIKNNLGKKSKNKMHAMKISAVQDLMPKDSPELAHLYKNEEMNGNCDMGESSTNSSKSSV